MLIVDIHDFRGEETSNNATAETVADWDDTTVYAYGDEAVEGDYVYYSAVDRNLNITPTSDPLRWVAKRGVNKFNMYDVYPDTYTQYVGGNLILKYNVTSIDTIFLGNIHGAKVTVTVGGNTYVKNIDTTSISPLQVWGVNALKEMDDYYLEIPTSSGELKIEIEKAPSDNNSSLGFINYGVRVSAGCTLIDSIKFNVRSGVQVGSRSITQSRLRSSSYEEMILPIYIHKEVDTKAVLKLLAKYRGIPLLVIGDDLGIRPETIFHGVYTDIEANIAEWNTYDLTLRSLAYSAFVQPTKLEEKVNDSDFAKEQDLDLDGLTYPVEKGLLGGVPQLSEFSPETRLIYDEASPCDIYYKDTSVTPNVVKKCGAETEDKASAGATAQAKNGQPTVSDFDNGALSIFNPLDCKMYYLNGGAVTACEPKASTWNGTPPSSAFDDGTEVIFDKNNPCRAYYRVGSTVKQCNQNTVGAYTGTPPNSAFGEGIEYLIDRSSPCDIYYLDSGTVTKCPSGSSSGGTGGGATIAFCADSNGTSVNGEVGDECDLSGSTGDYIIVGDGEGEVVARGFGGVIQILVNGTSQSILSDGDPITLTSGMCIRQQNANIKITSA